MQTFLPYPDFAQSAAALDYRRLGKQRVEAWQILQALDGTTKGWANHPATRMWRGHEQALCDYALAVCDEWIARGYNDSMRERFVAARSRFDSTGLPPWVGDEAFHASHRSNLKRKDPSYYAFEEPSDLPYVWPEVA